MARNGSGTHSLPAGNPVVAGTAITPTWANDTLADLSTEVTDSLSRSGKGGMLEALGLASGTVGAPGLAFVAEATLGLYRVAAGALGFAVDSAIRAKITTGGLLSDALNALTATSLTVKGAIADGATAVGVILDNSVALANAAAKIASFRNGGVEKAYVNKDGKGAFVGLDAGAAKITNVGTPLADTDAATMGWVNTHDGLARAWAKLTLGAAGAVTVTRGFNVASAVWSTNTLTVTLSTAADSTAGAIVVTPGTVMAPSTMLTGDGMTDVSTVRIKRWDVSGGGAAQNFNASDVVVFALFC